ncbi:MAG: CoA transferase [Rhodospirillaceae bacterium]
MTETETAPPAPPLAGLRVIDLTTVLFGPMATAMLADLGAEVIKVEAPEGDIMRHAEPMHAPAMSTVYVNANRDKRSVVLDLKQPAARAALDRLIAGADLFVHSMRLDATRRLGITAAEVRRVKPDIVYCRACGFGSDGPYRDLPAYDDVIQAASGLASLAGGPDGRPQLIQSVAADKIAGLYLGNALLTALLARERTGVAQDVELPMFESVAAFVLAEHLAGATFEPRDGAMGYPRVMSPNRRPHRTKDSFIVLLPYTTRHWQRFLRLASRDDLADAEWMTDARQRSSRVDSLYAVIDEVTPTRTTAEWMAALREIDVPATPVNDFEALLADPHLNAVGFFETYDHPSQGRLRGLRRPARFSAIPPGGGFAPELGRDTRAVLAELGYKDDEITGLIETGAANG